MTARIVSAHLLHRGEQFEVSVDGVTYVGECAWSWDDTRRTYPVYIAPSTIKAVQQTPRVRLTREQKLAIAQLAKTALEEREGKFEVIFEVIDEPRRSSARRGKRR